MIITRMRMILLSFSDRGHGGSSTWDNGLGMDGQGAPTLSPLSIFFCCSSGAVLPSCYNVFCKMAMFVIAHSPFPVARTA